MSGCVRSFLKLCVRLELGNFRVLLRFPICLDGEFRCGYLLKKTPPARLIECLREAMNGGAPMSPEVASRVVSLFRAIRPPDKADYHLTPHEVRLLKLLVEGHSYKTAATELRSSVNTIGF